MDRGAGERHPAEGVTMAVKFEGQPPFILPEVKSAQAAVFERSVVVTLYSEVEGQGPGLVSIKGGGQVLFASRRHCHHERGRSGRVVRGCRRRGCLACHSA